MLGLILIGAFVGGLAYTLVKEVSRPRPDPAKAKNTLKAYKPKESVKVIGIADPYLVKNPTTLTTTKFDTTTYYDRALVTLTNSTGSSVRCNGLSIRGKQILQHSGYAGFRWDYSDYADIERNGEKPYELSNYFLYSGAQCEYIGDYLWKELRPHKMYQVLLVGAQYQFDLGDVWHLSISNTLHGQSSENELIDVDVEILGTQVRRSANGIGETLLDCRVPSGAWTKTTSRRANRIAEGNPAALNNRGNIITVASSTYAGQADYYCTGDTDEIIIAAAIAALDEIGGGELRLTEGTFDISNSTGIIIDTANIITITGSGRGTILHKNANQTGSGSSIVVVNILNGPGFKIRDIIIALDGITSGNTLIYAISILSASAQCIIRDIIIKNISDTSASISAIFVADPALSEIDNCEIYDITGASATGISFADKCSGNYIHDVAANIASGTARGLSGCKRAMHNRVENLSGATVEKYYVSYADSGTGYACADTPNGGFNS